ncbi:proteasome subunit beta type-4 [Iris pallida]|uniref:Proteasome subunit beta type-4 n=1 Tax=Iris pallida TaxID=29817 RepID=A0AAX6EHN6_IRIPA|nr:proteasome subunit beta type-4 [Iris pallida]
MDLYRNPSKVVPSNGVQAPEGSERTLYPYVTGTSVIGMKYNDGVIMAADTGGSYGSTIQYKGVERIKTIGKHSLLRASGQISDF